MLRDWFQVGLEEREPLGWAVLWHFFLLGGYYVLRPVRETMGLVVGVERLHWLFLATFTVMLLAVPTYSVLAARVPRWVLIRIAYRFFALNLVGFWLAVWAAGGQPGAWTARLFFVWVSVFVLFVVSMFWSFMADVFRSHEAKRLFGIIAGGGTLGALAGSAIAGELVARIGLGGLLLIPIAALELSVQCARRLDRVAGAADTGATAARSSQGVGGGALAGLTGVFRSGYLLGISVYLLLATSCGTTLYMQQAEIVRAAVADNAGRTQLFATINFVVQLIALFLQTLVTGRLIRLLGLSATLAVLPAICMIGFVGLGLAPTLLVLVATEVARRAVVYGVAKPARELLFTVVSREDKYKTKSFIDTVVYRGGDVLGSSMFHAVRQLGAALSAISFAMVPVTMVWLLVAWGLGKRQQQLAAQLHPDGSVPGSCAHVVEESVREAD